MNRSYYAQAVTDDDPTIRTASIGGLALGLLAAVALFLALVAVSYPAVGGVALLALGGVAVSLAGRR
jgi:preprotein translocase subunit SecY